MNKDRILAVLREKGVDLKQVDTLDAFKAALAAKGIEGFKGSDDDAIAIKDVWAAIANKTVTVTIAADAGEDVVVEDASPVTEADDMEDEDEAPPMKRRDPSKNKVKAIHATNSAMGAPAVITKDASFVAYDRRAKAGRTAFESAEQAERVGSYLLATAIEDLGARKCRDLGVKSHAMRRAIEARDHWYGKAGSTLSGPDGGNTIPSELDATLEYLREEYGVARQLVGVTTMQSDTCEFLEPGTSATVNWVGESAAPTESSPQFKHRTLTARKQLGLSYQPFELLNDSAVNIAEAVATDFAYDAALKEDSAYFLGDGTSTYAGIVGLTGALNTGTLIGNSDANAAWASLTIGDFEEVIGLLPQYAMRNGQVEWVCSQAFYAAVMHRLATAAGGNTVEHIEGGVRYQFLGFPVRISQVLPKVAANNLACFFGNYRLGSKLGEVRNSQSMDVSTEYRFNVDQVAFRFRNRVGVNVYGVGDATTAGPILGLTTA